MRFATALMMLSMLMMAQFSWAQTNIKSFKEWKMEQVNTANDHLVLLKKSNETHSVTKVQNLNKKDPNLVKNNSLEGKAMPKNEEANIETAIMLEQNRLEMARDLSVTDYFVGYLAKQSNRKQAYKDAAGKLSPDEVAELLAAYANSVFEGRALETSPSAIDQNQKEQ